MNLTDLHSAIDSGIAPFGQREVRSMICADLKHATADNTGRSFPLGSTVLAEGVNFSVFSRRAGRVELLLFDDAAAAQPARVIERAPYIPLLARIRRWHRPRTGLCLSRQWSF